jgi:hypothetical protein
MSAEQAYFERNGEPKQSRTQQRQRMHATIQESVNVAIHPYNAEFEAWMNAIDADLEFQAACMEAQDQIERGTLL